MGEANFYYFTCLKLHLVFSGLQLFEREMANSLAIVLVLATIAHLGCSRIMTGDWASKVCAAYYKASELGAFPSVYPGGSGWNDKVCLADPSFYLECKFVNGVFVGEKRQCPPGKLFYHGANQMWEKTCVPADKCKTNRQCPDWLGMMPPSPVLTECQRQRESALKLGNYAPSCDINGNFKPLQCGAGFCWCVYADGTKIPNTKCDKALSALTDAKCLLHRKDSTPVVFKPLQCRAGFCWCAYADGTKILNTKVIAAFSTLTDAKCAFYRITPPSPIDSFKPLQCGAGFCWCAFADGTKIPNTKVAMALSTLTYAKCMILRMKVPTPTEEVIIPVGMTKRQCACKVALKLSTSGSSSAYACDPHLQQNYLICQDDGTFESKSCPAGEAWNYMEKTCSDKMRKCRPIPATCAAL